MKKGRHRRYEEARAFKRSNEDDIESLFERLDDDPFDLPTTREATMLTEEESEDEYDD